MATVALDKVPPVARRADVSRVGGDTLFRMACLSAATLVLVALGGVVVSLAIGGWPAFRRFGFSFLTTSEWNPVTEVYGAAGPIVGTLITSFLALLVALPLALGVAIFLVEFCPAPLAAPLAVAIELLAGIPSIVYGMWGLFVLAPFLAEHVYPWVDQNLGQLPIVGAIFRGPPLGIGMLTAGLVLAVMIIPFISSVMRDVFETSITRQTVFGVGFEMGLTWRL